jgi:hypothetical protein
VGSSRDAHKKIYIAPIYPQTFVKDDNSEYDSESEDGNDTAIEPLNSACGEDNHGIYANLY